MFETVPSSFFNCSLTAKLLRCETNLLWYLGDTQGLGLSSPDPCFQGGCLCWMGVLGVFREGCLGAFAIPVFRWCTCGDEAQEATLGSLVDVCLDGILVAGAVCTFWVEVFRRRTFLGLTTASGIPVSVDLFLECHSSSEV